MKANLQDQMRTLLIQTARRWQRAENLSYRALGERLSVSAPYAGKILRGDLALKSVSHELQEQLAICLVQGEMTSAERLRRLSVLAEAAWGDAGKQYGIRRHANLLGALLTRELGEWHESALDLARVNDRVVETDRTPHLWLAELDAADATARRHDQGSTPSASGERLN